MGHTERKKVKSLKPGRYMMIDEEPCEIKSLKTSKPGKHGSAKANITAVGVFDGEKRTWTGPADKDVDVPIIDKKKGQVVAKLSEDRIQLMDMEEYDTFEVDVPEDYDKEIEQGEELRYQQFGDRILLVE